MSPHAFTAVSISATAPGLDAWVRATLSPHHTIPTHDELLAASVESILRDVPVLEIEDHTRYVFTGRMGEVATWQLSGDDHALIARAATAPFVAHRVPDHIVRDHPHAYHQTWIGDADADQAFSGWFLGDDLLGILNIRHRERVMLFAAQFAGAGIKDYDGYWEAEGVLRRLTLI
jgi:hypothetical protein